MYIWVVSGLKIGSKKFLLCTRTIAGLREMRIHIEFDFMKSLILTCMITTLNFER